MFDAQSSNSEGGIGSNGGIDVPGLVSPEAGIKLGRDAQDLSVHEEACLGQPKKDQSKASAWVIHPGLQHGDDQMIHGVDFMVVRTAIRQSLFSCKAKERRLAQFKQD